MPDPSAIEREFGTKSRPDHRLTKEPLAKQGGTLRFECLHLTAFPAISRFYGFLKNPASKTNFRQLAHHSYRDAENRDERLAAGLVNRRSGIDGERLRLPVRLQDRSGNRPSSHRYRNQQSAGSWTAVGGFLAHLGGVTSGKILISSEAFTNALDPAILKTFLKFIGECNARIPTRIVISLRRIDSFMESMYLHSVKVGESSLDLAGYVGKRGRWAKELFQGLTAVRERSGGAGLEVVRYEASESFFGRFFDAMGLPFQEIPELSHVPRENIRLGLKAQTVLRHFNQFADLRGMESHRPSLVHDLMWGKLQFDEDVYSYRLLSFEDANRLHSQAMEASLATGFPEYEQFFREEKITARDSVTLDPSNVTEADLLKLKAHLQQG